MNKIKMKIRNFWVQKKDQVYFRPVSALPVF